METEARGGQEKTESAFTSNDDDGLIFFNTFKYHVSCTDGKISVRIVIFITYFSTVIPLTVVFSFLPLMRPFQQVMFHAPMRRPQTELNCNSSPSSHSIVVFFPVDIPSLSRYFQRFLLGVEGSSVSWLEQLTVGVQITIILIVGFRNFKTRQIK